MTPVAFFRPETGEIVQTTFLPLGLALTDYPLPEGTAGIETDMEVSGDTHWVEPQVLRVRPYSEAGKLRKRQRAGGQGYRWSPALEDWIDERPLDQVKADAWSTAKRTRDAKLAERAVSAAGIAYRISKDKDNLIALIASRDAAGTPDFVLTMWMDDDNRAWTLGGAGLRSLAAEMGSRGQQIYQRSWALRDEIAACQSADGVKLIDIEADWP